MNFRAALRFLGRLIVLLGAAELIPAVCSQIYGETGDAGAFLLSAVLTSLIGGAMILAGRGGGELYRREGILIVVGGWLFASLLGGVPYLLTGVLSHPVDALFEAASGFTTTGATVLLDIEGAGRGVLFWRSLTQWLGGMGIIVLFVALLSELGPGARYLYKLEVPGPTSESLQPRIRDTASIVWEIYLLLTVAETVLLLLCGLDLYDALTHTFCTLSTGGFSPYGASIAAFPSPWVHLVIIAFMIIAGGNFSLYYGLRKRRGWNLLRDTEFRIYLGIVGAATVVVAVNLMASGINRPSLRVLLDSLFQVSALITTTGFASADFEGWPALSRMLLLSLMFVGGCAGSTSGSMKVMRMVVGLKAAFREVRLIFSPSTVVAVLVGGKAVPNGVVISVMGFFILFLSSWGVGTVLLTVGGNDLVTAATASIAALGNIGPGLGEVGPTDSFAFFSAPEKLLLVLLMLLGRLEVYSIAALFSLRFWKR